MLHQKAYLKSSFYYLDLLLTNSVCLKLNLNPKKFKFSPLFYLNDNYLKTNAKLLRNGNKKYKKYNKNRKDKLSPEFQNSKLVRNTNGKIIEVENKYCP